MSWRDVRARGGAVLLDGGTGSELRRRGIALSDICWSAAANLAHEALLTQIHLDYVRAGADIVTANTFANARFVLAAAGLDDRFDAINRAAIQAARTAAARADRQITVAASLSCLPPAFDPDAYPAGDAEYRAYAELAEAFAAEGVDLVLLEMLQSAAHAGLACRAVEATGLDWWAGVSCRLAPADADSGRIPRLVGFDAAGTDIDAVLGTILEFSPAAVAIMHTPLDAMVPALERLRADWPGPVAAYAELPYPADPEAAAAVTPSATAYAAAARSWLAHGAGIIGGCCGTGPEHIAALRTLIDGLPPARGP